MCVWIYATRYVIRHHLFFVTFVTRCWIRSSDSHNLLFHWISNIFNICCNSCMYCLQVSYSTFRNINNILVLVSISVFNLSSDKFSVFLMVHHFTELNDKVSGGFKTIPSLSDDRRTWTIRSSPPEPSAQARARQERHDLPNRLACDAYSLLTTNLTN